MEVVDGGVSTMGLQVRHLVVAQFEFNAHSFG
jgi:hypothetical protein